MANALLVLGGAWLLVLLFALSLCRVAALADRQAEEAWRRCHTP